MKLEKWFCWKKQVTLPGEESSRLVDPWDDNEHVFVFDFSCSTEDEAKELLDIYEVREEAKRDGWILVEMTLMERAV